MPWKARECYPSILLQVPAASTSQGSLHHSDCKKCSQSCFSQWSEGDPDRDPEQVLDSQGTQSSEVNNPLLCRLRHEGAPFQTPMPPALPTFRVQEEPPFTFTGIDYAGPLYTRTSGANKVWICLFTCCVTRAIHLELVTDMSTETFKDQTVIDHLSTFGTERVFNTEKAK